MKNLLRATRLTFINKNFSPLHPVRSTAQPCYSIQHASNTLSDLKQLKDNTHLDPFVKSNFRSECANACVVVVQVLKRTLMILYEAYTADCFGCEDLSAPCLNEK